MKRICEGTNMQLRSYLTFVLYIIVKKNRTLSSVLPAELIENKDVLQGSYLRLQTSVTSENYI